MSAAVRVGAFVLTIALASLPLSGQTPETSRTAAAKKPAPKPSGACVHCGTERWDVKTLSDAAAKNVNFTPKTATVKTLYSMKAPTSGAARHTSENQAYTVHAKLVGYKIEFDSKQNTGDHDFHIVIQDMDGPQTIVVEIPDPVCAGVCTSLKKAAIAQARADFQQGVTKQPESEFLALKDPVEVDVTGVLFFDFAHGQTGLAKNCVELHPVTAFAFSSKPTADSDKSKEPPKHPASFYKCLPESHGPTPHP
jgi:hypothetical protein